MNLLVLPQSLEDLKMLINALINCMELWLHAWAKNWTCLPYWHVVIPLNAGYEQIF